MSERAKIRARRVTGNDAQQQRAVARAIRVAREMALLPYSVRQVTHRSKGKRGDRDGGTLREFREPPRPGAGDAPPEGSTDLAPEMDVDATTEFAPTDVNGAVDAPTDEAGDAVSDEAAEDAS
jgi:small subunit ribosomal protein S18